MPAYLLIVSALALASCGGGGGGSSSPAPAATPTTAATSTPVPTSTATTAPLDADGSQVEPTSGGTDLFTEAVAGTSADTSNGGSGNPVDGVACNQNLDSQSNLYHIHAHLSIFSSGAQVIVPQGIGLVNAGPVTGSAPNTFIANAGCIYTLHTHDRSGIIHIEDETNGTAPTTPFTLGELFDIWGQPLTTYDVAGISGNVTVYVTQTMPDSNGTNQPTVTPYQYMSNYANLPLVDHQEVTIEVNTPFAPIPRYSWPAFFQ